MVAKVTVQEYRKLRDFASLTEAKKFCTGSKNVAGNVKLCVRGVTFSLSELNRWILFGFPETKEGKMIYWKLKTEGYFNERN